MVAIIGTLLLTACAVSEQNEPQALLAWEFPPESSGFTRVSLQGGPEEGQLIAGYNLEDPANPIIFTMYVYPGPDVAALTPGERDRAEDGLLSLQFEDSKAAIVNRQPVGSKHLLDRAVSIMQRGEQQSGQLAVYEVPTISGSALTSVLYLFRDGAWYIKYRVSYPTASASEAEEAVAELMSALEWS